MYIPCSPRALFDIVYVHYMSADHRFQRRHGRERDGILRPDILLPSLQH